MKYVTKESICSYTEKNSKFISICLPIKNMDDFKEKLGKVKETYKDAKHYTFALRILSDKFNIYEKFSDNKEPYGTAGIPMLNILKINSIVNTAIVTVRYFGGVKLGKSNLLKAYLNTANEALKNASVEEITELINLSIEFPYNYYEIIYHIFTKNNVNVVNKDFSHLVKIELKIPKNLVDNLLLEIKSVCPEIKTYFHSPP